METQCAFHRKLAREFVCRGPSRPDYDTFRAIYSGREPVARGSKTISRSTESDYSLIRHLGCYAPTLCGAGFPRGGNSFKSRAKSLSSPILDFFQLKIKCHEQPAANKREREGEHQQKGESRPLVRRR